MDGTSFRLPPSALLEGTQMDSLPILLTHFGCGRMTEVNILPLRTSLLSIVSTLNMDSFADC